ncbi:MAG: gamma-glutamyl kinase [Pseudomonadota bacterium]
MMVFFKPRLVFLSNPKTATTAYQAALGHRADLVISGPPGLKHASLRRYQRFIQPMYKKVLDADLEVLVVVREPISWLGSWYRYRRRSQLAGHPNSTKYLSFDDFVRAYCLDLPPPCANVGAQEHFVKNAPKNRAADHIFAYENQDGLQRFLKERIGPVPSIPICNSSAEADLSLASATEAQLRKKHAEIFDLYERLQR